MTGLNPPHLDLYGLPGDHGPDCALQVVNALSAEQGGQLHQALGVAVGSGSDKGWPPNYLACIFNTSSSDALKGTVS